MSGDSQAAGSPSDDDTLSATIEDQDDSAADQLEAMRAELADVQERLLRAVAEQENMRRRFDRDRQEATRFGIASFAKDVLTVADQLDMALAAVPDDKRDGHPLLKTLMIGVSATARTLTDTLGRVGITVIDAQGQPFDPNFHEVMDEVPGTGQAPGTVVQVLQRGWKLHDRLLRPARVRIAKDDQDRPHQVDQVV